jgi:NADH:ubiquinone oxidoreductase subunit F (NADH-binding)
VTGDRAHATAEFRGTPAGSEPAAAGLLPRLLVGVSARASAISLAQHAELHGPRPGRPAAGLIGILSQSGLRGRGGAAFPTATKLAAVARSGKRAVVVANGSEGEPASAKDRFLLRNTPHLVLDGAVLAAEAVGAREAFICTHAESSAALATAAAIDERHQSGADRVRLTQVAVPARYVAGEESALVHLLNGGPAKPTMVPPRPFERGVGGRPTLVQNVETLAHIALIARHGPEWFRALGTHESPGSALITVSGAVRRPGVFEIALGAPIADVIRHAGGDMHDLKGFLIGGYFGTWISAAQAAGQRLDEPSLRAAVGGGLGAGVVVAIGGDRCGLAETAHLMRYLAQESAGQCGPCVHGLAAIADEMTSLARGDRTARVERLVRWSGQVSGRGACRHPDGAVRLLASALRVFDDDVAHHLRHGPCATAFERPLLPVVMVAAAR